MVRNVVRFGVFAFVASAIAVALFGCGSGGGYGSGTAPAPTCTLAPNQQIALVYPAPNSGGNPASLGEIVIAANTPLSPTYEVILTYPASALFSGEAAGTTIQAVSPPFTSPNQTPSFSNPFYYASTVNNVTQQLPTGVTVSVGVTDINVGCAPLTIGSFGT